MYIHTVKSGESVYTIAREYAVPVASIIEANGLTRPDRLTVGEELLILVPSRSYTAKRGETVSCIARRFGLKKSEIFANNPSLLGREELYDGQLLSLKYSDVHLGMGASNGYFFKGCSEEALARALPYLTYVTIAMARAEDGRITKSFDGGGIVKRIIGEGKIPLVRIYDENSGDVYEAKRSEEYADALIDFAKREGFLGITLSIPSEAVEREKYEAFIVGLKRKLIGCDLILFTEATPERDYGYVDYSDGCILSYDKISLPEIPSFEVGERAALNSFAEKSECAKTFVDLSPFAYSEAGYISYSEALNMARERGLSINIDNACGVCSYSYEDRSAGKQTVRFESLKNIKAKLETVGELGYMGISIDILRCPISHLMMYNALFSEICYSAAFSYER